MKKTLLLSCFRFSKLKFNNSVIFISNYNMRGSLFLILALFANIGCYSQTAVDYYNRGLAKDSLDSPEAYRGAIADYTKAIELDPKFAEAYYFRGIAKGAIQDAIGAIDDYTKAIEINPKYVKAYNYRGNQKMDQKDYIGAIDDYTKAIEIDPKDISSLYYRGVLKNFFKDYRGAIADFTKIIELNSKDAEAYYNRGLDARAYYSRGLSKVNLGRKDSGCLDFSKAGELGEVEAYESIKEYCQ